MWQFTLFCVKSLFIFNNLYGGGSVHLRHENKLLFQLVNIAICRHPQMDPLPKSVEPSWSGVPTNWAREDLNLQPSGYERGATLLSLRQELVVDPFDATVHAADLGLVEMVPHPCIRLSSRPQK